MKLFICGMRAPLELSLIGTLAVLFAGRISQLLQFIAAAVPVYRPEPARLTPGAIYRSSGAARSSRFRRSRWRI
ncbi:hypothetical protein ABTQ07_20625, partial [Acinetobacter baumannii]